MFALNSQLDLAALTGSVTNAKGLLYVSGITTISYTDPTPSMSEFWVPATQAASAIAIAIAIAKNAGVSRELIVTHPSNWFGFAGGSDSSARPITIAPGKGIDYSNAGDAQSGDGIVGNIAGLPSAWMPMSL